VGPVKIDATFACTNDVKSLHKQIAAGQTICSMHGNGYHLQAAMRHQTEACFQTGGGHLEQLLYGNVKALMS
jgi:hypothetical protein